MVKPRNWQTYSSFGMVLMAVEQGGQKIMDEIVDKWDVGGLSLLTLDKYTPSVTLKDYKKVEIDGIVYQPETVYDLPNTIAIPMVKADLVGKNVKYL